MRISFSSLVIGRDYREPDPEELSEVAAKTRSRFEQCGYHGRPENAASDATLVQYVAHYRLAAAGRCDYPRRGLFLHGPAGTGKTFAARIIAAILDIDYFTVFELGTAFSMAGASGFWGLFESCRKQPMVLDDLGNESNVKSYSNVLPVRELLIARHELWQSLQCPTIITSNFASRKEISAAYGEFVTSRLLGMCDFVQFRGTDQRLRRS